ncbi:MAG: glucose-1-phosphate cytidylyltransferase [Oscillospiraceae bacterium]|nr:glucose-1-phosphate cytidylyltransferase [Oscillospiraceae bacterium]
MKTVILAGGLGTRISEESYFKPKPMIEIGNMPILWHIMKHYSFYGFNDFIICCGYKANIIKEYFASYYLHRSDVTFDFSDNNKMTIHSNIAEPWRVTLADTGQNTMTGGRIKRVRDYIGDDTFMLTYGDGVSDVNLEDLLRFHKSHGKYATLTAVSASQKFGIIDINEDDSISAFREKSNADGSRINAGFMVLEPSVIDYIENDSTVWEKEPLQNLSKEKQLMAYTHQGFWQCMDTQRDKQLLEKYWEEGNAPWKIWL